MASMHSLKERREAHGEDTSRPGAADGPAGTAVVDGLRVSSLSGGGTVLDVFRVRAEAVLVVKP